MQVVNFESYDFPSDCYDIRNKWLAVILLPIHSIGRQLLISKRYSN